MSCSSKGVITHFKKKHGLPFSYKMSGHNIGGKQATAGMCECVKMYKWVILGTKD